MNEAVRMLLETIGEECSLSTDPATRARLRFALESYRHALRSYMQAVESGEADVIN